LRGQNSNEAGSFAVNYFSAICSNHVQLFLYLPSFTASHNFKES